MIDTTHPVIKGIIDNLKVNVESAIIVLSRYIKPDGSCDATKEELEEGTRLALWHLTGGQEGDRP